MNTITFYLEDDDLKEVPSSGKMLTFTLQGIKTETIKVFRVCQTSFQNFKNFSPCVMGGHQSARLNIYGGKTSNGSNVIFGPCSFCKREKSTTVSDNKIPAEDLCDLFKSFGKKGINASKKMAKNILKNPGQPWDITANVASRVSSRHPKVALSSLPEVINFCHTGKGLYL